MCRGGILDLLKAGGKEEDPEKVHGCSKEDMQRIGVIEEDARYRVR